MGCGCLGMFQRDRNRECVSEGVPLLEVGSAIIDAKLDLKLLIISFCFSSTRPLTPFTIPLLSPQYTQQPGPSLARSLATCFCFVFFNVDVSGIVLLGEGKGGRAVVLRRTALQGGRMKPHFLDDGDLMVVAGLIVCIEWEGLHLWNGLHLLSIRLGAQLGSY